MAETFGHPILEPPYGAPLDHHDVESEGQPRNRFPVLGRHRSEPVSVPDLKEHMVVVRELRRDLDPRAIDLSHRLLSTTNKAQRETNRSAALNYLPTHPSRMVLRQEGAR
ncbi:MAG: hypothetical protein ACREJ5_04780 [Geminicoccaceae bacterium]